MKLWIVLALCALSAAAPSVNNELSELSVSSQHFEVTSIQDRSILVNALIRQLFAYIRFVINHGSVIFRIPPLDPLLIEHYHLYLPAGLINLDLELKDIVATGLGDFVVHRSHLNLATLTFDFEISVPELDIRADAYDLVGDLYSAIPLYGNGKVRFLVENFVFSGVLYLKQSDDERSILVDRVESPYFDIPHLKSELSGVIGGGDIDGIVNAVVEDVIMGYVSRFQSIISHTVADVLVHFGNPLLDQLDTWKYIAPLLPREREQ